MSIIGNMPGADLPVTFPSGKRTVNMVVLLAETHTAEHKARFGVHLARNAPTIATLRKKYDLDYFYDARVKTWEECAATMRHFYNLCSDHIKSS